MSEDEFLERWEAERPMYEAWGNFVAAEIREGVRQKVAPVSVDLFIRMPPKPRLKENYSLLEKAFYRKAYDDPYMRVTDKVGARFVVLLTSDLKAIADVIEASPSWQASKDRDYEDEQKKNPIQFDYAAIHYVVYCNGDRQLGDITVKDGTPCEVQVKTILQHAYSELTHDTIYKPKVETTPEMLRTAAKSMALIEATNDYFEAVVKQVDDVVAPERELTEALIAIYRERIGEPILTRVEGLLLDALPEIEPADAAQQVRSLLDAKPFIVERVRERGQRRLLYRQPSVLLVYHFANSRPNDLKAIWPLTPEELEPIYTDLGLAFDSF